MRETKKDEPQSRRATLRDEDIEEVAPVSRRSVVASIGAAVAALIGGAAVLKPSEAEAGCRRYTGASDSDAHDRGGFGNTNITDSDPGDNPGCGRGGRRFGGGPPPGPPMGPPPRYYRRRSCTDSDGGRFADRAGFGRRCN